MHRVSAQSYILYIITMNSPHLRSIILFFILLGSVNVCAQSPENSILWKATRAGKTIYLLGAIHQGYQAQYPVREQILDSLKSSSVYVTESLIPFLSAKEAGEQMKKTITVKSEKTLKALLKEKQCSVLAEKENFQSNVEKLLGKDLSTTLLDYSPSGVIYLIYGHSVPVTQEQQIEMKVAQPMEYYLADQSKNLEIRHESLDPEFWESLDALNALERCNLAVGMANAHVADDFDESQGYKLMEKMRDLWLAGNATQIKKLSFLWSDKYALTHGNVEHKWLDVRNKIMSDKILKLSNNEQSPIFVAVGAAHLTGKMGILSQLREAGFNVTPI